jgi:hypothetical protein
MALDENEFNKIKSIEAAKETVRENAAKLWRLQNSIAGVADMGPYAADNVLPDDPLYHTEQASENWTWGDLTKGGRGKDEIEAAKNLQESRARLQQLVNTEYPKSTELVPYPKTESSYGQYAAIGLVASLFLGPIPFIIGAGFLAAKAWETAKNRQWVKTVGTPDYSLGSYGVDKNDLEASHGTFDEYDEAQTNAAAVRQEARAAARSAASTSASSGPPAASSSATTTRTTTGSSSAATVGGGRGLGDSATRGGPTIDQQLQDLRQQLKDLKAENARLIAHIKASSYPPADGPYAQRAGMSTNTTVRMAGGFPVRMSHKPGDVEGDRYLTLEDVGRGSDNDIRRPTAVAHDGRSVTGSWDNISVEDEEMGPRTTVPLPYNQGGVYQSGRGQSNVGAMDSSSLMQKSPALQEAERVEQEALKRVTDIGYTVDTNKRPEVPRYPSLDLKHREALIAYQKAWDITEALMQAERGRAAAVYSVDDDFSDIGEEYDDMDGDSLEGVDEEDTRHQVYSQRRHKSDAWSGGISPRIPAQERSLRYEQGEGRGGATVHAGHLRDALQEDDNVLPDSVTPQREESVIRAEIVEKEARLDVLVRGDELAKYRGEAKEVREAVKALKKEYQVSTGSEYRADDDVASHQI